MKIRSLAAALLCMLGGWLMISSASAAQLYSNGPFITHAGAHVSGADVSLAQDETYPGYTALGLNAGPDYRLSDDFTIPANHFWTISSVVLFAYQADSADADFNDARVIIWKGVPGRFGSTKAYDGTVANGLVSTTPGAYRSAQSFGATQFSNDQRRIKRLLVAIPELELGPGTYYLDWQLKGPTATSTVYTPPVSILGQAYTSANGFALMKCPPDITDPQDPCTNNSGRWVLFENGTSPNLVDLPFEINGSDVANLIFANGFDNPPATP